MVPVAETTQYSFDELSRLDRLDVDHLKSLFTIELGGEGFYTRLAAGVTNPQAAALLIRNGREEASHAKRLRRAISAKLGSAFIPDESHLPAAASLAPIPFTPELVPRLMAAERDGEAIYQRWAAHETNADAARLLLLNAHDEAMHARRIERVAALLF